MTWHAQRFEEIPGRVACSCKHCGRAMWLPPSKAAKYTSCSTECQQALRDKACADRARACLTCGGKFVPRPAQLAAGGGKYCCVVCAEPTREAGRTKAVAAKRGEAHRANFLAGRWVASYGKDNPRWNGGVQARRQRRLAEDPLERARKRREYLRANPHKAKEWNQSRGRSRGRLPRGTVQRIYKLQMGRCAYCRRPVGAKYHLDHHMPLALGGKHEAANLQILCPTCNVRKSGMHPVVFAQRIGFLL